MLRGFFSISPSIPVFAFTTTVRITSTTTRTTTTTATKRRSLVTSLFTNQLVGHNLLVQTQQLSQNQRYSFTKRASGGKFSLRNVPAESSYEVDEVSETPTSLYSSTIEAQLPSLESVPITTEKVNGNLDDSTDNVGRFDDLLKDIGLIVDHDGTSTTNTLKHVRKLSTYGRRIVSLNDIFCNRDLRFSTIKAIGFDMDYTLAQYQQPAFDMLAFNGAKAKLVEKFGYPVEVLDIQYDHSLWTRGLIIDTQRGNFLKIDRHKYVRVAYHGLKRMSSKTRKFLYSRTFNKVMSFSEKHFINLDTLFQFVDAHLFASLIEMKDSGDFEELDYKTYEEIYKQIRDCVDLCHRDGVIKDEVHRDPSKYIVLDKGLIPMLQNYRKQGVKTFLLTNSLWEYTSTAMNYLYHGKRLSDEEQKKNEWMELFDTIIVGSCKPAYMLDPYLNLFRVDPQTGTLRNTDGVYEIDALGPDGATKFLEKGKTFQGGNWLHLQAMLQIQVGEEILYVGDHLYSDVLRSKRTLGWRSVFVMPELEDEMTVFASNVQLFRQLVALRQIRDELGKYADGICRQRMTGEISADEATTILDEIHDDDTVLKEKLTEIAELWHVAFHPVWGAMFNAGYQDSRFAFYVSNYACLYTSRATNLGLTSSSRNFRTSTDSLPHDKLLEGRMSELRINIDPWNDL